MIRPLDVEGLPTGIFTVDPTCTFLPGQVGGLVSVGGEVLMSLCDGVNIPPYGMFDDIKTASLVRPMYQERVLVVPDPAIVVQDGANYVTLSAVSKSLRTANIISASFRSDVTLDLNPINGVVTFPAGTILNYDTQGDNVMNGILAIVSYTYEIAGVPGEDTTRGSGKVTVWNRRGEYIVDQFDTLASYPLNAPLYVCNGKFTTTAPCESSAVVGMVTGPPSSVYATLQLLWF